jgi:hypothetical protein
LFTPQFLDRGKAGRSTADDDDSLRHSSRVRGAAPLARRRRLLFDCHEELAVAQLDCPARDRAQGRGVQRFPRAQAEAGMVPRASHGVFDHEPFRKRSPVMRTARADREEFIAVAREQDSVLANVPGEHVSIRDIIDRDPQCQVGASRLRLLCAH